MKGSLIAHIMARLEPRTDEELDRVLLGLDAILGPEPRPAPSREVDDRQLSEEDQAAIERGHRPALARRGTEGHKKQA
jgi:hypothetical protein